MTVAQNLGDVSNVRAEFASLTRPVNQSRSNQIAMLHKPDRIDEHALDRLIEESQDIHTDAMAAAKATLPDLTDMATDRRRTDSTPAGSSDEDFEKAKNALVRRLALSLGGVFGFGAVSSVFAKTAAAADGDINVMQLQTAVSLELLAVATYGAALTLPFIANGNPVIVKFAQTTMSQHDQHRQAFSAQTTALGGTDQTATNPKYTPIVEAAKPTLLAPLDVVKLAATLEQVATETYLADLNRYTDVTSRVLMASVMGVECQHPPAVATPTTRRETTLARPAVRRRWPPMPGPPPRRPAEAPRPRPQPHQPRLLEMSI
jgi:Ferritin-like domain